MVQGNEILIIEPTGRVMEVVGAAPRLDTLKGKTVGVLWNGRAFGDESLRMMLALLAERYGVKETKFFEKYDCLLPAALSQLDDIAKQVDAMVTGIGD